MMHRLYRAIIEAHLSADEQMLQRVRWVVG